MEETTIPQPPTSREESSSATPPGQDPSPQIHPPDIHLRVPPGDGGPQFIYDRHGRARPRYHSDGADPGYSSTYPGWPLNRPGQLPLLWVPDGMRRDIGREYLGPTSGTHNESPGDETFSNPIIVSAPYPEYAQRLLDIAHEHASPAMLQMLGDMATGQFPGTSMSTDEASEELGSLVDGVMGSEGAQEVARYMLELRNEEASTGDGSEEQILGSVDVVADAVHIPDITSAVDEEQEDTAHLTVAELQGRIEASRRERDQYRAGAQGLEVQAQGLRERMQRLRAQNELLLSQNETMVADVAAETHGTSQVSAPPEPPSHNLTEGDVGAFVQLQGYVRGLLEGAEEGRRFLAARATQPPSTLPIELRGNQCPDCRRDIIPNMHLCREAGVSDLEVRLRLPVGREHGRQMLAEGPANAPQGLRSLIASWVELLSLPDNMTDAAMKEAIGQLLGVPTLESLRLEAIAPYDLALLDPTPEARIARRDQATAVLTAALDRERAEVIAMSEAQSIGEMPNEISERMMREGGNFRNILQDRGVSLDLMDLERLEALIDSERLEAEFVPHEAEGDLGRDHLLAATEHLFTTDRHGIHHGGRLLRRRELDEYELTHLQEEEEDEAELDEYEGRRWYELGPNAELALEEAGIEIPTEGLTFTYMGDGYMEALREAFGRDL